MTSAREAPTTANANQHYMHLTNYSLNKKSAGFVKAGDPLDPSSNASKRTLTTLLAQIEAQEAAEGRLFDQKKLFAACEEVVAVLVLGRGDETVGSPRRARIYKFELFELKILSSRIVRAYPLIEHV